MKNRCLNKKAPNYVRYGGRGIRVCDEWLLFENFLADMGERPDGMTLDRFPNVNGNYEPGNCRWATVKMQQRNTRVSVFVQYEGVDVSIGDLADRFGIKKSTLAHRISAGWPITLALNTKPTHSNRYLVSQT